MKKSRVFVRLGAGAVVALTAVFNAAVHAGSAATVTFDTGRFLTERGEVYSGVFGSSVTIDALTVGEATFRARLDEFIEVASVRLYVAPAKDAVGEFRLLTDEQLASGEHNVAFAFGRDTDPARFVTALDVMQGLDLSRMLFTDGSMRVRLDVLLASPLRDSTPGGSDLRPEVLILGSFSEQCVRAGAIIGGNVDRPILAGGLATIDHAAFDQGRTGIATVVDRAADPQPISIVGLDLHALGVRDDTLVIGFRLEIEAGASAVFNVSGAGGDLQRGLASPVALMDEPEHFADFDLGANRGWEALGGSGGAGGMMQAFIGTGFPGGGGFSGGGGGGGRGGFPPLPITPIEGDNDNGNGNGNGGGNGNGNGNPRGGGNGNSGGGGDPIVPAPGTLLILLASILGRRSRRRRDE